jgi:hypothetical protein
VCQVEPSASVRVPKIALKVAGTAPASERDMSTKDLLRKSFGFALPLLGVVYVAACGGSATFHGDGSAGSAGSGSLAGTGGGTQCNGLCPDIACGPGSITVQGECCPTCIPAGTGGGSFGTAGSGSGGIVESAGTSSGGCTGLYACPAIACGPGSTTVMDPVTCCATCVTDNDGGIGGCAAVGCVSVACATGYTLQKVPGDCCPMCQPDAQACTSGEQGYQTLRSSLLAQPGATSCMSDSDCTPLIGAAQCGDACTNTAVNASLAKDMTSQLDLWAADYCSTCTPVFPPCAAPPAPFCSGGQCQLYHLL